MVRVRGRSRSIIGNSNLVFMATKGLFAFRRRIWQIQHLKIINDSSYLAKLVWRPWKSLLSTTNADRKCLNKEAKSISTAIHFLQDQRISFLSCKASKTLEFNYTHFAWYLSWQIQHLTCNSLGSITLHCLKDQDIFTTDIKMFTGIINLM